MALQLSKFVLDLQRLVDRHVANCDADDPSDIREMAAVLRGAAIGLEVDYHLNERSE